MAFSNAFQIVSPCRNFSLVTSLNPSGIASMQLMQCIWKPSVFWNFSLLVCQRGYASVADKIQTIICSKIRNLYPRPIPGRLLQRLDGYNSFDFPFGFILFQSVDEWRWRLRHSRHATHYSAHRLKSQLNSSKRYNVPSKTQIQIQLQQ